MTAPESNEVAAHQYRLAQANRLIRYCEAQGVSAKDVQSGAVKLDLTPICDPEGKIVPEPIDYDAISQ